MTLESSLLVAEADRFGALSGLRTDYDIGRVYRLIAVATSVAGAIAVIEARSKPGLRRRERWIAGATGAAYAAAGAVGWAASPSRMAYWFQRRPRRVFLASAAPLALVRATGGARTPLYRLVTIGAGTAGGMRERSRDAQVQALIWGAAWSASTASRSPASQPTVIDLLRTTVGFVLSSRVSATASQVAYDTRNLFDQLFDFTYERESLQPYVIALKEALDRTNADLRAAAHAEPRPGIRRDRLVEQAIASVGRLEERLGVLEIAGSTTFALEDRVHAIRKTFRPNLELLESRDVTGADALRADLHDRVTRLTELRPGAPAPQIEVGDVEVVGLRRLALINATATAATTNALRHAPKLSLLRVRLTRAGDRLVLDVDNDGVLPEAHGARPRTSGLAHLGRKVEAFTGSASWFGPVGEDRYRVRITLPADDDPERLGFWPREIQDEIAETLMVGTRYAAAKSILTVLVRRRPADAPARWLDARTSLGEITIPSATHSGLIAVAELLAWRDRLRWRSVDAEAVVLGLAAVMNYRAGRAGYGLSSTWVNGFASRYAGRAAADAWQGWSRIGPAFEAIFARRSQQRAYLMAALNVAALYAGLRDAPDRSWDRHVISMALGPLLMCMIVNPAQPRTRKLDRAIDERLAEVEGLLDLADSFHANHAAPPAIRKLAGMVADEALAERLHDDLDRIDEAEDALRSAHGDDAHTEVSTGEPIERLGAWIGARSPRLQKFRLARRIWREPVRHEMPRVAVPDDVRLGEYLQRALERRVWPAAVQLSFDEETVGWAPDAAIQSAAFRRQAVAAMDVVARGLVREFGRDSWAIWQLRRVDLHVSVVPWTGTVQCELTPWAPAPGLWRRNVDRLHDVLARVPLSGVHRDTGAHLRALLAKVRASPIEWTIFTPSELDSADVYWAPGKRLLACLRRGRVVVHLHPQEYARERVDFARRVAEPGLETILEVDSRT